MPVVKIEPTDEYPVPYDTTPEELDTFADKLSSAASTAELLETLGAPVEVDPLTLEEEKKLLDSVLDKRQTAPLRNMSTALGAAAFLRNYGQQRALDVDQARAALTNKLFELADCGDPKLELKAIELLGKHSDIGLFTQRSEISVKYENPESLENAIKERVKRLLHADIIDVKPLGMDLDEELGLISYEDGEFTEVDEEELGEDNGEEQ